MRSVLIFFALCFPASAQVWSPVPYIFANGTQYNPSQLQADFQAMVNAGNSVGAAIHSAIASHTTEPSGIVMWFNLSSCPTGWTDKAATYGSVFVRGVDLGRGQDTTGTSVGGAEAFQMQDHTHSTSIIMSGVTTTGVGAHGASAVNPTYYTGVTTTTNILTGNPNSGTHGADVHPQNITLLICKKN